MFKSCNCGFERSDFSVARFLQSAVIRLACSCVTIKKEWDCSKKYNNHFAHAGTLQIVDDCAYYTTFLIPPKVYVMHLTLE